MPTVLRVKGFRFFFYSNENFEPAHIHIEKGDGNAKVWLTPKLKEQYFYGFTTKERKEILEIISNNLESLLNSWNERSER